MGGICKRQIKSARQVLAVLIRLLGRTLNDEALRTLMVEVETVVNSQPLTVDSISDADSKIPIPPCNMLTMISNVVMLPPGHFKKRDLYCRKRWR